MVSTFAPLTGDLSCSSQILRLLILLEKITTNKKCLETLLGKKGQRKSICFFFSVGEKKKKHLLLLMNQAYTNNQIKHVISYT